MTLQQLQYFREIAKDLHFSNAADRLYTSQSSLSHSISALEKELDTPLFVRKNGRTVEITEYGKIFLQYVESALDTLAQGTQCIELMRNPVRGNVRIGYSHTEASIISTYIVSSLQNDSAFKDVSIQRIVNHTGHTPLDKLKSGSVDLIYSCARIDEPGIVCFPFARQEMFFYVHSDNPLAKKDTVTINDLKNVELSFCKENTDLFHFVDELFKEAGLRLKSYKYYPDWATQITTVSSGEAACIMPAMPFSTGKICRLQIEDSGKYRSIYVSAVQNDTMSVAIKRVLEYHHVFQQCHAEDIF